MESMWRLQQKVHSSWIVAVTSVFFVSGVVAALYVRFYWWAGIVALLPFVMCFFFRRVYVLPVVALVSAVIGISFGSAHLGARDAYKMWIGKTILLEGRVREDPSKTSSGATSLQLENVRINSYTMPGAVYVSIRGSPGAKRGDVITVTGSVKEGFGNFPINVTATKVDSIVRPVPGDVGRVARDWFADRVRAVVGEPEASLGIGFLTGQKSALSDDLSNALKIAGLTHIVVASGYNLTILVRLARRLFLKLSKFL